MSTQRTILVTGANGFLGNQLVQELSTTNTYHVRMATRTPQDLEAKTNQQIVAITDISASTDWSFALHHCDVIIHTAARVHVMKETESKPIDAFRRVNVEGTLHLANQAAQNGVKRFIFISTIKVNGENTSPNSPFHAEDTANPQDAYALSKHEAEQALINLSRSSGMEIVIIRPPLIYGPQVKGNFQLLLSWLQKGYPLPLKSIHNRRSFVSVYNLVDLIIHCIEHPAAANEIFLVSDKEDLSTSELIKKLSQCINKPARLFYFPPYMLFWIGKLLRKEETIERLLGSLQVDVEPTCKKLNWKPIINVDEGLRRIV